MAADDEEPPNDTAGEEHGDDAGKSHDGGEVCGLAFVVALVESG